MGIINKSPEEILQEKDEFIKIHNPNPLFLTRKSISDDKITEATQKKVELLFNFIKNIEKKVEV